MKNKARLSAFLGFFFALIAYFLLQLLEIRDALIISIFTGLMFHLLLFSYLFIHGRVIDKRYAEIEKSITSPIFYKTNGNFNLGNGKVRNGNIYFCESGIACVCLDEKPYTLDELLIQDIERYEFDNIHLNIFTKDGRIFLITTSDAKNISNVLQERGWIKQLKAE